MCDYGRFGWKYVLDEERLKSPVVRRGSEPRNLAWESVPEVVEYRFERAVAKHGAEKVAVVLSPMMACEEAWLLASFIRTVAPESTLVTGYVPVEGEDELFPAGAQPDRAKFTIRKEKCPNRRGVELIAQQAGGPTCSFVEFVSQAGEGKLSAAWLVGGYPDKKWVPKELAKAADGFELLVVQDIFANELTAAATVLLPSCAWLERDGSFMNHAGRVQPFERAVDPPEGAKRDGQYLFEIAGHTGLYSGERVRELMCEKMDVFAEVEEPPPVPAHQH
jgi:NADH-quinone oxidoreductase subunit G